MLLGADGALPAVLAHDGLENVESKTGALHLLPSGVGRAEEPLEEVFLLVWGIPIPLSVTSTRALSGVAVVAD